MNRKDKINLINQLEIGQIPFEMFQKPRVILKNLDLLDFRNSKCVLHDEDLNLIDLNSSRFGINPFTAEFYGVIKIYIVK
jgi:hypothetical protein